MAAAFVKNVGSHGVNATTRSITVPAGGCAAGNVIVIRSTHTGTTTTVSSVTDSRGNTYSEIGASVASGTSFASEMWAATLTTALQAGDTITVTYSAKVNGPAIADEFSGVTLTEDFADISASGTSTTPSSGAQTPTQAAVLLIGQVAFAASSDTTTEDSDSAGGDTWHSLTFLTSGTRGDHGAYKITTSAVSQTYNPTLSGSVAWMARLLGLRPSSTGQSATANPALETDTALALARLKTKTLGIPAATDTALPIGRVKTRAVAAAVSDGAALALGRMKRKLLGVASGASAALAITTAVTRDTITLSGVQLGDISFTYGGKLFAISDGSPAVMKVWSAPLTDLATYTTVTFPSDGSYNGPQGGWLDAAAGFAYVMFNVDLAADPFTNRIIKIDLSDNSYTTFANPAMGTAGLNPGPGVLVGNSTHLYALTKSGSEKSWVYQFLKSDGSTVSSRQLSYANAYRGHTIQTDGTRLYVGGTKLGTPKTAWAGWVELDLSGDSQISLGDFTVNDDSVLLGSYFYVGDESAASPGRIVKVAKDLSSSTGVSHGVNNGTDALVVDNGYLLAGVLGDPGTLVWINPADDSIHDSTTLLSGEDHLNEIVRINGALFLIAFRSSSWVTRLPDGWKPSGVAILPAISTSSALAVGRLKVRSLGASSSAETAVSTGRVKTRSLGVPSVADSALPFARRKSLLLGVSLAVDSALVLARSKKRALGASVTADAAIALPRRKARLLGVALGTSSAVSFGRLKTKLLAPSVETDSSLVIPRGAVATEIGAASESDTAGLLGRAKRRALGVAFSADTSQVVVRVRFRALGVATSTSTAVTLGRAKRRAVGIAAATDSAVSFVRVRSRLLGIATSTSAALALGRVKVRSVATATEADLAVTIGSPDFVIGLHPKDHEIFGPFAPATNDTVILTTSTRDTITLGTATNDAPAVTPATDDAKALASATTDILHL